MSKLGGKVAIVTGASKGIGASIAEHLGAAGASVVVNYASSKSGADRVVSQIEKQGGKAIAVQADLAKPADVARLFAEAKKAFGRLDILVNNAGIYEFAPLEEVTPEHFHKAFDLNVLGLILASQQAAKQFGPGGGSIINISSVVATSGPPGEPFIAPPRRLLTPSRLARQGTWSAQDPGQLDQPWNGRNRRRAQRRIGRGRIPGAL